MINITYIQKYISDKSIRSCYCMIYRKDKQRVYLSVKICFLVVDSLFFFNNKSLPHYGFASSFALIITSR